MNPIFQLSSEALLNHLGICKHSIIQHLESFIVEREGGHSLSLKRKYQV